MIETNAILLTDAYKDYATFRSSIKTFMVTNLSSLLDIDSETSFETNYQKSYDYVMQTIYNYYSNYYLMSGLLEDFERLFSTAISGKLPEWQVAFTYYLKAKSENYKSVSGSTHTGSSTLGATSDTLNKSAQTPEDIGTSADYIDNYSTSEQKYHTAKSDNASSNLSIDNTGSPKDLWENIKNIPQKINKEVIALVGKYFFSEGDEEMSYPLAYLTLTQKMKDLQSAKLLSHTLTMSADYSLKSYIETEGTDFTATLDFKPYILDEMIISYDNTQNHIVLNWTLKDGTSNETSVSLPQVTANYDGLMIKTDKTKLDGLIPFALTFVAHDDYYPVQLDSATSSLYVRVPKGSIPFASETQAGVVQLFTAPTTDTKTLTPTTDGNDVPIETDANHKMFVNIPKQVLASKTTLGVVKIGDNINVDANGVISIDIPIKVSDLITTATTFSNILTNLYTFTEFSHMLVSNSLVFYYSTTDGSEHTLYEKDTTQLFIDSPEFEVLNVVFSAGSTHYNFIFVQKEGKIYLLYDNTYYEVTKITYNSTIEGIQYAKGFRFYVSTALSLSNMTFVSFTGTNPLLLNTLSKTTLEMNKVEGANNWYYFNGAIVVPKGV